jgi:hypothetical protein
VSAATIDHAAAADSPPINDRVADLPKKPKPGFCGLDTSSTTELTGLAQNVKIDPLGELGWVGASLDDVHRLEFLGVE